MGDCITPAQIADFAVKDINRLQGAVARVLARTAPYIDVMGGGTLSNDSDVVQFAVQEQAVVAASLTRPGFVDDVTLCGPVNNRDQVGQTLYPVKLQSYRGEGPRICVKVARTAFKSAYAAAQVSLEKGIRKIINADARRAMLDLSGIKAVINSNYGFYTMVTGDQAQVSTPFLNVLPNAEPTFKWLYRAMTHMIENLQVEPFQSDGGTMLKVLGGVDIIEKFRNQLDVKNDMIALTTGKYKLGADTIAGYSFKGPYRGVAFGIDDQPLRFYTMTNGVPNFVEPEISVNASKGVASRNNPAWLNAPYEVMFLFGDNGFNRLTPEGYTGEGTFKFAPQLNSGELKWSYNLDNDCNKWGDFGNHLYQISRAIQPVRPHAVLPIIFQRCPADLGIVQCAASSSFGL